MPMKNGFKKMIKKSSGFFKAGDSSHSGIVTSEPSNPVSSHSDIAPSESSEWSNPDLLEGNLKANQFKFNLLL